MSERLLLRCEVLIAENDHLTGVCKRTEQTNARLRRQFQLVGERLSKHLPLNQRYDFAQQPWSVNKAAVAANIHLEQFQKEVAELQATIKVLSARLENPHP